MTAVFLVSLIVGLLAGVRFMMVGVERPAPKPRDAGTGGARVRLAAPAVAAFAFVFGLSGYALSRGPSPREPFVVAVAAISGVVAAVASVWLITRSARVMPKFDTTDPRYALQGHLARVVRPISASEDGEIAFEEGTLRRVVRARSVSEAVGVGADVVIERIEDEIAYVEPWHQVEKRL